MKEKQVYMRMIATIEKRIRDGTPMFGDKGLLKDYKARLAKLK